jgi:hypothetical protein
MTTVPDVPWALVAGRIQRRILQAPHVNPHFVLLAQTRGGKDHLIRWGILPVIPMHRTVVLVTKHGGDDTWAGWGNVVSDLKPGFGRGPDGTPRYLIQLRPGAADTAQVRRLLEMFAAEGEMAVILGDAARITDPPNRGGMHLDGLVTAMMEQGAGIGLTVGACANSASWAASGLKDQAAAVLIGLAGGAMRKEFAEIAGLPRAMRPVLDTLAPHWWLYTDHADREMLTGITIPPAAGWYDESWPPGPIEWAA